MDGQRFDAITRSLATTSRRRAVQALAGGALGAVLTRFGMGAATAQVEVAGNRDEGDDCNRSDQCERGLRCCNGRCRDIRNDPRFCGGCRRENTCDRDQICRNGGCFNTCRGVNPGVCDTDDCGTLCGCGALNEGGDGVCKDTSEQCRRLRECDGNADCPLGQACVDENCCNGKRRVCLRPCAPSGRATAAVAENAPGEQRAP